MALRGKWREALEFMADAYAKVSSVRDGIEAERNLQGFFMAYLNLNTYYYTAPELELSHGYCDFFLLPDLTHYATQHSYILELKVLSKRSLTRRRKVPSMRMAHRLPRQRGNGRRQWSKSIAMPSPHVLRLCAKAPSSIRLSCSSRDGNWREWRKCNRINFYPKQRWDKLSLQAPISFIQLGAKGENKSNEAFENPEDNYQTYRKRER